MGRLFSLVVLAAVVVGGYLWWQEGGQAGDDLVVRTQKPSCEGTRTQGRTVVVSPGMRCTYRVVIRNTGDHEVRLSSVEDNPLAERGDGVVRAEEPSWAGGGDLDRRLEPGDAIRTQLVVVYREDGEGGPGRVDVEAPVVRGTLWVRPFSVEPNQPLRFRVRGG